MAKIRKVKERVCIYKYRSSPMEIKCERNTRLGSIRVCEALNIWHTVANEGLLRPEPSAETSQHLKIPQTFPHLEQTITHLNLTIRLARFCRLNSDDSTFTSRVKSTVTHVEITISINVFMSMRFFPACEIKFPDVQINTFFITRVKTVTLELTV